MKLLLVVPSYPWAARSFAGVFNHRCAIALRELGADVEVLSPRPYTPPVLGRLNRRWNAYSQIPRYQREDGILVHRPTYLQIPGVASAFWMERGAFLACRRAVAARHEQVRFDAILSFDLLGAGGLAWLLGRHIGVFSAGWATGGDIRVDPNQASGRAVARALRNLDLVFYQSKELFGIAAKLFGVEELDLDPLRHVVLSRGIMLPPLLDRQETRSRIRARLRLREGQTMVLSLGRIEKEKGVYELLAAATRLADSAERIRFVLVGASPGFDESDKVEGAIEADPALRSHVQLLPSCPPEEVWEYLAAADIFAFSSHGEGMPNTLLEAMAMELPIVAFAIPPVVEVDAGAEILIKSSPFDAGAFALAIQRLSGSAEERRWRGVEGRAIVQSRFLVRRNMALAVERLEEGILLRSRNGRLAQSGATARQAG